MALQKYGQSTRGLKNFYRLPGLPLTLAAGLFNLAIVLTRFCKFVLVLALACSIGLHWAFLQSLAWTSMLADNLRHDSLTEAVKHTFDGRHPCQLCKAIASGQKSEKKSEGTSSSFKKLECPLATEDFALTPPRRFAPVFHAVFLARALSESPPTPPPRNDVV